MTLPVTQVIQTPRPTRSTRTAWTIATVQANCTRDWRAICPDREPCRADVKRRRPRLPVGEERERRPGTDLVLFAGPAAHPDGARVLAAVGQGETARVHDNAPVLG